MERITDWEASFANRIYRLGRMLRKRAGDVLAGCEADVSPEQWAMLLKLRTRGLTPQSALVDEHLDDRPNIARMVEGLVRKGLVVRGQDVTDRRKRLARLSEKGEALVARVWPVVAGEKERMFSALSNAEQGMLSCLLDKLEDLVLGEPGDEEKGDGKTR